MTNRTRALLTSSLLTLSCVEATGPDPQAIEVGATKPLDLSQVPAAQRSALETALGSVDALTAEMETREPEELPPHWRAALVHTLRVVEDRLAAGDPCGASDWILEMLALVDEAVAELEASLDPSHPGHHGTVRRKERWLAELATIRADLLRLRVKIVGTSPAGQACGGVTVGLDPDLDPVLDAIPHFEADQDPRPLAALRNARGVVTNFVANELWLVSNDQVEADATAAEIGGDIIATVADGDGSVHSLVRVDSPTGDPDTLPDLLAILKPGVTDAVVVSSQQGRVLLATAAELAVAGYRIGFNPITLPDAIRDGTSLEAVDGPSFAIGGGWSRNAFDWVHFSDAATQAIGVTAAWQLLDNLGLAVPLSVGLGVIDGGFQDNDLHPDSVYRSTLAGFDALGGENPFSPWHGTKVMQAAAALHDNLEGAAGVAGPVARPINIYAGGDFFAGIMIGTRTAIDNGARVVNVSSTADVPSIFDWLTLPSRAYTGELRDTFFVASAGNGGPGDDDEAPEGKGDVDALECFLGSCWESTFHTPCENPGVVCVGGLGHDSLNVDRGSNFGTEHSDSMLGNESVDIYAPFCVPVDGPGDTPTVAETSCGTSLAAPQVAGVVALMWAADPTLPKDWVALGLRDTARTDSPDPVIHRIVDAEAAVRLALLPGMNILEPTDGLVVPTGVDVTFTAFRFPETTATEVTWESDRDGELGTGLSVTTDTLSPGAHDITVSDGFLSDSVSIQVTTIGILSPDDGDTIIVTETDGSGDRFANVDLLGTAFDPEDGPLGGAALVWTDRINGGPAHEIATGTAATVPLYIVGGVSTEHELTLTATDSDSNTQSFVVTVTVDEFI